MKKIMILLALSILGLTNVYAEEKQCVLENYSGDEGTFVQKLGDSVSYSFDKDDAELLRITSNETQKTIPFRYSIDLAHPNTQGDTFINGRFVSYLGQFVIYGRAVLFSDTDSETLTIRTEPSCSGGYIGGCKNIGKAVYSCQ